MHARIALLLSLFAAACGTTTNERKKAEAEVSTRVDIQIIAREVMNEVQNAAYEISSKSDEREIRRAMLVWQINTFDLCHRALQRPDPRAAFVDIWMLIARARVFAKGEPGARMLGAQQPVAVSLLDGMMARLETRAKTLMTDAQLGALKKAVDESIAAAGESDGFARAPSATSNDATILGAVLAVPEGIFSIGGGVKDTAVSISEAARAAEQGVDVVNALPQKTRWQLELLLLSVEENESIVTLLQDMTRASEAIAKIGDAAATLPADVERTGTRILAEAERTQPEFQKTLSEGRQLVETARATIGDVEPLLASVKENGAWIEQAAGSATDAGKAWTGAFEQLNLLANPPRDPSAPPPEPSPPFDMKDVVTTSEHATTTAESVRAAVQDLRAIVEGDAASRIGGVAGETLGRVSTIGVTWILTFFGALLAYRLIVTRVAARRAG